MSFTEHLMGLAELEDNVGKKVAFHTSAETIERLERERNELAAQVERLRWCAESAIGWIDSVPSDTELPAMPGFDRDEFDSVMAETPAQSLEAVKLELRRNTLDDVAHAVRYEFEGPFSPDAFDDFIESMS